jgi:hypothetical protein
MQAAAPCTNLARRLRAAEQQERDDGEFAGVKLVVAITRIAETLHVLLGSTLEVLLDPDQVLALQDADCVLHLTLGQRHDRLSRRFLVTRVGQRIQGQWVLVRRHDGLLDQTTDDADFNVIQHLQHGRLLTVASTF